MMIEIMFHGTKSPLTTLIFIPMWSGSIYAIVTVISVLYEICNHTKLISPEQRIFLRMQGKLIGNLYMDYESLPLLRRLFFWGIVSAVFSFLAVITQVLYYLWLVEGLIGIWNALIPVIIMLLLFLAYVIVMTTVSYINISTSFLLVAELVLFTIQGSKEAYLPWSLVFLPLFIVQIVWFSDLTVICKKTYCGEYNLTYGQIVCVIFYISSFLLGIVAEFITIVTNGNSSLLPEVQ